MRQLLFVVLIFTMLSCSQSDKNLEPMGKAFSEWELVEIYSDPGNGRGNFHPINSDKKIWLYTDGTFESNFSICYAFSEKEPGSTGIYSLDEKYIKPESCEEENHFILELNDNELIIYYFCIEGCAEKYKKMDMRNYVDVIDY